MKILGINASPRKDGNTETLLDKALEGAYSKSAEIKKISLASLNISPISEKEYENVNLEGLSVVDDDMKIIYREIASSDAVLLASPIFFGSLSSQAKIMIDRFQPVWVSKNILRKKIFSKKIKAAFIAAGAADRKYFFENASQIARNFFAVISAECVSELFCPGLDKKEDILKHPEYLEKAYEMGKRLATEKIT